MRRLPFGLSAGFMILALGGFLFMGCGGAVDDYNSEPLPRGNIGQISANVGGPAEQAKLLPQKPEDYKGVIAGHVVWEGDKPDIDALTKGLQGGMVNNRSYCLTGKEGGISTEIMPYETFQQSFRIGDNNRLGNVFVWIAAPAGFAFNPPDNVLATTKSVEVHQPHCAFLPHCSIVVPWKSPEGKKQQTLIIENDARVAHNAKVQGGPINGTKDQLLGSWDGKGKLQMVEYDLKPERDAITVSCGVHAWMRGFVRVFDHPFAAVTSVGADPSKPKDRVWENPKDPKYGSFEIKGVPVGAKVKLYAWHEQLQWLVNGKEITIDADPKKNEQVIPAKMR
jgi:hypothetical protein